MKNWYIVQTFSGFEQKVAETLKETVKKKELENQIEDVLVPVHEVTEVKRGKRVQRKKKYFPSYVLVKMEMNKELYHMIKNIQKVTGFLGSAGLPAKVSDNEINMKIHKTIQKVTKDIFQRNSFNTAIASIMELVNNLTKYFQQDQSNSIILINGIKVFDF